VSRFDCPFGGELKFVCGSALVAVGQISTRLIERVGDLFVEL